MVWYMIKGWWLYLNSGCPTLRKCIHTLTVDSSTLKFKCILVNTAIIIYSKCLYTFFFWIVYIWLSLQLCILKLPLLLFQWVIYVLNVKNEHNILRAAFHQERHSNRHQQSVFQSSHSRNHNFLRISIYCFPRLKKAPLSGGHGNVGWWN